MKIKSKQHKSLCSHQFSPINSRINEHKEQFENRKQFYLHRFIVLLLGSLILLATACSDQSTSPSAESEQSLTVEVPVESADQKENSSVEKIPGQYIIVFKEEVKDVPGVAKGLINAHGGELRHTYQHAIKGFSVSNLPPQALVGLERNPHIDIIEQDFSFSIRSHTSQTEAPWGLDRIDQRDLPLNETYNYENDGSGVNIYIVDTGINLSHDDFGGRASMGIDYIDDDNDDCEGHGTHVAGIAGGEIWGVAKAANLIAVRVADCNGNGFGSNALAGIDWITNNHDKPAVVNMSFGWPVDPDESDTPIETAVKNSIDEGIFYAGATDNRRIEACGDFPSRISESMTVARTNNQDRMVANTGFGPCIDIFAPGQGITSADEDSDTGTDVKSGTSMATPHVVGVAALHMGANPSWTPAQVMTRILDDATENRIGTDTNGNDLPDGTPDKLLFVFEDLTTSTALTSSPNPSIFGDEVDFTASVSMNEDDSDVSDGTVTFITGGTCESPTTTLASDVPLNSSGQAVHSNSSLDAGSYTVTACYSNHNDQSEISTEHIVNPAETVTELTIDPTERQYSDEVTLSAEVSPESINDSNPSGSVDFQIQDGSNWTSVATAPLSGGSASEVIQVTSAAGAATYRAVFSSTNDNFNDSESDPEDLTIIHEDALITYDEDNPAAIEVSTEGGDLNAGELVITVEVQENETTFEMAEPGEIGNADLSVSLIPVGPGSIMDLDCSGTVSGSGYDAINTFSCENMGPLEVNTYEVDVNVTGDYYTAPPHMDALTVYDPSLGFTTAGGTIELEGERVNFGFVMRYNPSGKNIKGNLIVVRHHTDGTKSRLKSNALGSLAVGEDESVPMGWASFDGKSVYTTWDPVSEEYITEGNQEFNVYVEDRGNPGSGIDRFWIKGPGEFEMPGTLGTASSNTEILTGGSISVPQPKGNGKKAK